MSNDKYSGPWAPGMLYTDDDGPPVRIVNVPALPEYPDNAIGDGMAPGVATHDDGLTWYIFGDDGTGVPDWSDAATVGALSGVVRSLYNEPRLDTVWIDWTGLGGHAGFCLGWYAFSSTAGTVTFETCVDGGAVQHPTREGAWLAAYHAHRDAAGLTANDIEVIRG